MCSIAILANYSCESFKLTWKLHPLFLSLLNPFLSCLDITVMRHYRDFVCCHNSTHSSSLKKNECITQLSIHQFRIEHAVPIGHWLSISVIIRYQNIRLGKVCINVVAILVILNLTESLNASLVI